MTDFANGDGTFTAVISDGPSNFQRADGAWAPIDNTVVPAAGNPGVLVNKANAWQVRFGSTAAGVSVDIGSRTLVMRPLGARTVAPTAVGDTVTYRDVWPDTDLVYTVTGGAVRESLLLKSGKAAASQEFSVRTSAPLQALGVPALAAAGFAAGDDGSVRLTGPIGAEAHLEAPAVLAHDGSITAAAGATLQTLAQGTVRLAVSPAWLAKQPASAFPVDVDPTITLSYTAAHSYKSDGYTCSNCGVQFGNAQDGGNVYWRSVAHFDYAQLFGDTVTAASFSVRYYTGTRNAYGINVHHATALSYAGAAAGSVLATGSIASGKLSGSGLTRTLATWVKNRTPGGYFGFTGNESTGLYTYQKDTTTLSITYSRPTVPGAPRSVSAVAGHASATVSFSAPISNGGAAITRYTATASPGGRTATGTRSPLVVPDLTNGTRYTFTVKATNAVGTGPSSAPSNAVTPVAPAGVPGAPTSVTATAGDASAKVSFSAPTSTGGAAITKYTVTSSPGGLTATGPGSPITVTGLTNGTSYTFTVKATNSVGTGAASAPSAAVTPQPASSGGGTPIANLAKGWDVDAAVTASQVSCMKSSGYSFSLLYTDISATDWQTTYAALAANGMQAVLQQGYGDGLFTGDPSQGTATANTNIAAAHSVNYPQGADFFIDVESTDTTHDNLVAWLNNWAAAIKAAGYVPAIYSGVPTNLTDADLSPSVLPDVKVYWQSESGSAPDPAQGYVAVQTLGVVQACNIGSGVDVDTAYIDKNGNHLIGS